MTNEKPEDKHLKEDAGKGWVFVALQPEQLFIVHSLLRIEIRKARKARRPPRHLDSMLMAEFILENVCTSLAGMSADE